MRSHLLRRPALAPLAAVLAALSLAVAACGGSDDESDSASSSGKPEVVIGTGDVLWSSADVESDYPSTLVVKAEEDPQVESQPITFAQAPYNDHSFLEIGLKQGWFDEVGLKAESKTIDMDGMVPALVAGEIDVGTMANSIWLGAMDQTTDNKMFTYADTFIGHAILGNPKANYKTLTDFLGEGMPYEEAVTAAMEQMKGKKYAYSPETSQRTWQNYALKTAGMSFDDVESVVLEDPKIVELATSGGVDFASPTSGPLVTTLLRDGWTPVVAVRDLIDAGGADALKSAIVNSGAAATNDWLKDNHATALRFAGVSHRVIGYKDTDLLEAAKIQIPFLNSIAGTSFTPEDAEYLDTLVDPFFTFEEQADMFENQDSPWYYLNNGQAAIDSAVAAGTQQEGHEVDEIILADDTWRELKSLKETTEKILAEVGDASGTAGEHAAKAKELLAQFAFLDALRFAGAAKLAAA